MIKDISVDQANLEQAIMKVIAEYIEAGRVTKEEVSDSLNYLHYIWNLDCLSGDTNE